MSKTQSTQPAAQPSSAANSEEIATNYAKREAKKHLYAFHQPDLRLHMAERERALSAFLKNAFDGTLSGRSCLDVGCGKGGFLRQLAEWGADPADLTGTELLPDRIQAARLLSPPAMTWHLGDLESLPGNSRYDLLSAFTVFSSVLDQDIRKSLACQMWEKVKPGGWVVIFDFKLNNPNNSDVRKVTRRELRDWWPAQRFSYQTLLLLPPLARLIAPRSYPLASLLAALPPLRSHFIYAAHKPLN